MQMQVILNDYRVKYCLTMETFGQYLAAKRKQAGLSQRELAARVGVSPTYISYLERDINPAARGRPQPSVDLVDRLARALGCPVNEMRLKAGYAPAEQHDAPADFLDRIRVLFCDHSAS